MQRGVDISSIKRAVVSGAAFPPSLQDLGEGARHRRLSALRHCRCRASIAYETSARDGMVLNENLIVEIVRPGTGRPRAGGRGRRDRR